jgi:aminomethyltransferase
VSDTTSQQTLRQTSLWAAHKALGARMVPFGGWDMPVQYTGITNEHQAVRQHAGMFDVSHMGEFIFTGPDALNFLQSITVNDVSKLKPGRAHYNMLPNSNGGLVDDIYIYCLARDSYMMVVNASNIAKDWLHINKYTGQFAVTLEDKSDDYALIAVQGPEAATLLDQYSPDDLLAPKKNSVFATKLFEHQVLLARTGYTGEDGYEVFIETAKAAELWQSLLGAGLVPCGLGARDTLRLEAGFPLYGHEFNDLRSPLDTPMAWAVKLQKDFVGHDAMQSHSGTERLLGLKMPKGIPREGYPVLLDGQRVGTVASGTMSPSLKVGIALAYLRADIAIGAMVDVEVRGQPMVAEVVEPVFVKK